MNQLLKMNVSEHITLIEATDSPTAKKLGIDNTPNDEQLTCMRIVAEHCFEPLRKWYGKPIHINSFFRSEVLNRAINGKPNSQHLKGEAIDISAGSIEENKKLFDWIKTNLSYDQLIWENGGAWVHVSFTSSKGNRNVSFGATQIIPK